MADEKITESIKNDAGECVGFGFDCVECGAALTSINSHAVPEDFNRHYGCSHLCIDCEQRYFERLAKTVRSYTMALFYCCIAYNVPFDINLVPEFERTQEPWKAYLQAVNVSGRSNINGEIAGFGDGMTDIRALFKPSQNKKIKPESETAPNVPVYSPNGTDRQRNEWGEGYDGKTYAELDHMYEAFKGDYPMATSKQTYILHEAVKLYYDSDRARREGKTTDAARLAKMADDRLASEQMRKKDEKPIEQVRIDAVVDALEKHGYMTNGKLLSYDQLIDKIRGDVPKYRYTKDTVDQAILKILNTMACNDGKPELTTLPAELRVTARPGEFAGEPNKKEREAYEKLGLLRMSPIEGDTPWEKR